MFGFVNCQLHIAYSKKEQSANVKESGADFLVKWLNKKINFNQELY